MASNMNISKLVALIKSASAAYYNGSTPIMDDETFDAHVDALRARDPTNPFLETVGAPPSTESSTPLPFLMPSLDKIKPGQPQLTKFLKHSQLYVVSEKLDGISALWLPQKRELYLRGDGRCGQSLSSVIIDNIYGLVPCSSNSSCIIRGELILPRSKATEGQLARSIVNGLIHQKSPPPEKLKQIHFVAYEVIQPSGIFRSTQFEWLKLGGFLTPWWQQLREPTEEMCSKIFVERRAASPYDTDGIVIGIDQVSTYPMSTDTPGPVKPPKDCVAFKMKIDEQAATTTLREVLWAPSAQGILIPRLRFDPVKINGAMIEYCSGHNARNIVDRSLGPSAQIKIRRSGDVIPMLDSVIIPAEVPSLPTDYKWKWATDDINTATHICIVGKYDEQVVTQLYHFAKTLGIQGLGPASCKALVEKGITGPLALWSATANTLSTILGPKTGATLYTNLRTVLSAHTLTEVQLMVASSQMARGVGETKLQALVKTAPDVSTWSTAATPSNGWTEETFREFQKGFIAYETWRKHELHWIPYPIRPIITTPSTQTIVCFTGFRDKSLETQSTQCGYINTSILNSKVKILVTADSTIKSEKVKKATEMKTVEIISRAEFIKKYLSQQ